MKKFKMDNSMIEQAEVFCYAFSPELLEATEYELKTFLKALASHFPRTDNGIGGHKPTGNEFDLNIFNNAYSNVCALIKEKRAKRRHCQILWISVFTLIVLVGTLANTVYTQTKMGDQQQLAPPKNTLK
jgi:hypothetical protein